MTHDRAAEVAALNETRADLAALRGEPAPKPWPIPHPGGLIAWAEDARDLPSPLPPLSKRRERRGDLRGWPVGLLPLQEIAADLRGRGVAFTRGVGYTQGAERLDFDEVGRLAADVLDDTADTLQDPALAVYRDALAARRQDSQAARLRALEDFDSGAVTDEDIDFLTWCAHLDVSGPSRAALAARLAAATPAAIAEDTPEAARERAQTRQALRHTADEVRTSTAARRSLVTALRPRLEALEDLPDTAVASGFLAAYDDQDKVPRSGLWPAYEKAGLPGHLNKPGLLALAEDRWGRPIPHNGYPTYRPTAVRRP